MAPDRAIYAFTLSLLPASLRSQCIYLYVFLLARAHTYTQPVSIISILCLGERVAQTRRDVSILKRPSRLEANLQASALIRVIIQDEPGRGECIEDERAPVMNRGRSLPTRATLSMWYFYCDTVNAWKILCSREQKNSFRHARDFSPSLARFRNICLFRIFMCDIFNMIYGRCDFFFIRDTSFFIKTISRIFFFIKDVAAWKLMTDDDKINVSR